MESNGSRSRFANMTGALRGIAIKALLVVTATLVALIAGELVLRTLQPFPGRYLTWPPNLHKIFRPDPAFIPGVSGPSRYQFNSQGIRGDEITDGQKYRVLAIGGSTTECCFQDQERTWPSLLERRLQQAGPEPDLWLGNLGKSGFNTRHHVIQMKYQVPQLPRMDAIIFLVGCNDLSLRLISGDSYDPDHLKKWSGEHHQIRRTFMFYPLGFGGLTDLKNTAWWRLIQSRNSPKSRLLALDDHGKAIDRLRKRRLNATELLDGLPDMDSALGEYARNINTLIDQGHKMSVRIVFLTQPSLWRSGLSRDEDALLWYGAADDVEAAERGRYYSVNALKNGMEQYNRTLIGVCEQRGVECIDLAARIPKDTNFFFDDVHFTDRGSRTIADILAEYFETKR